MQPFYEKECRILPTAADAFDRLKPSGLLALLQEVSGEHCAILGADLPALQEKKLFWAVLRHRVQINRLPGSGETVTMQTWPMPTTRTAYPRAARCLDGQGTELFRCISLWALMDQEQRSMVLPGKSGVSVPGTLLGSELAVPGSMALREALNKENRTVRFTELDQNAHMNNCRSLDWVMDALPGQFHAGHSVREFSVSYLSEAREGEELTLSWDLSEDGFLWVDALRKEGVSTARGRVFSARVQF